MINFYRSSMPYLLRKGPRTVISSWLIVSILSMAGIISPLEIHADDATPTTSVTVGNSAPTFTTAPHEDPTSDDTTPTNVGSDVTFKATATDANGHSYYLAICKTDSVTAGTGGVAPTCGGGSWAISATAVASGSEATVTYTVQASDTLQSYDWFGFACDNSSSGTACSAMSNTGTSGNNGYPFAVNHRPTFTTVTDEAGNPGATDVTITATSYNDTDSAGTQDQVKLFVCSSASFNGTACGASELCHSNFVTPTATLACDLTVPNPQAHGEVSYYPYIVDSHTLQASGGQQGSSQSYTVNDVRPTISGTPTFNGSSDITLTGEKSTTNIDIIGVMTDDNGCSDLAATNAKGTAWLTSLTYANCTEQDNNDCYYQVSCIADSSDTCGVSPDKTEAVKCTVAFQYYANPTTANTPWSATTWTATVIPADGQGLNASGKGDSGTREMNGYLAIGLATSYDAIAYGSMGIGENTATLLEKTRVEATGNVSIDASVSGTNMTKGGDSITVDHQKYASSGVAWASGTVLSGTPTGLELNSCKSGFTATPEYKPIYWGIEIPTGTVVGSYTGTNTITGVMNNYVSSPDWCVGF